MIGKRFFRLVVVEELPERNKDRRILYRCICDCGNEAVVSGKSLRNGHTRSCGCYRPRTLKQNAVKRHYLYRTYNAMKSRCYNINHTYYEYYGGRGITVCDRWLESFLNFIEDMGERPAGYTLDRVDNDKGYTKENCKWSSKKEQANNRRPNRGWRKKRVNNGRMC